MATFGDLYSSALHQELGTDDSTQLFTDARRKKAINAGVLAFADLTECYTRESTVTCSNGVGEYNLNSSVNIAGEDFSRLSGKQRPEFRLVSSGAATAASTRYTAGENFERRDVQWLDQYEPGWRDSTGDTPAFYYERMDGGRRVIGLYPPPRIGSSESGFLRIPYVAQPPGLTVDTVVPFTSTDGNVRGDIVPYHQAFAHYGASELEKLRKDWQASATQMQIFLGYVSRFMQSLKPKGGTTIKHARSYFTESRRGSAMVSGEKAWPW